MVRGRLAGILLVGAMVLAGCVNTEPGAAVEPAGESSPTPPGPGAPTPSSPTPGSRGEVPPRTNPSASPTAPSPGAESPTPAPAGWTAGVGTSLRANVEAAIAAGAPVSLPAAPIDAFLGSDFGLRETQERDVVLRRSPLLPAEAWAEVDGVRVAFPAVAVYEGEVEGAPDQLVRLTVTPHWARGSIRVGDDTHLVRIGLDGNLPPSTARAASWHPLVPPPARFDGPTWTDADDCLEAVPPYVAPMLDIGRTSAAALTARIVLDADAEAAQQVGPDVFAWMIAVLHETDAIYDHEVGIRFEVAGVHQHTEMGKFPEPASGATGLPTLEAYWNERSDVDRDLVHLFTGHESTFAQANCIGGAGEPSIAYSFTPVNWERDYVVFHTQAFAHEIGHLFSAHHHYGNHLEADLATIMIQGYTPGIQPVFGTLEKSVIRGWAEERL